jgi:hypothetical protein
MVTLIELCEARTKFIWVQTQTHRRLYDPSNYRDRKTLLEDAIKNEADSAETSGRVTRTFSHTAREKPAWPGRLWIPARVRPEDGKYGRSMADSLSTSHRTRK